MFLKKVINALNAKRVPYLLIGGYAVALHGAVRGTVDIDIAIGLNEKAYKNVEKALMDIGLKSRLPVNAEEVFHFRENYIQKRNLIAWSFCNPDNPLEIVDIIITEDAKSYKSLTKTIDGLKIKVISLEDLIKLKKKSGRLQDIEDVNALEKLK